MNASIKSTIISARTGVCLCLLLAGMARVTCAQNISASAQISSQAIGGGMYQYTITLNDNPSSLDPIQTFWYAWVPGGDFLPSNPGNIQAPNGWTYSVQGGGYYYYGYYYPDGYSLRFVTTSGASALNPGSSLQFGFTSPDSPATIFGNSPQYTSYPIGTSYVYSGNNASGDSSSFTATQAPEPAPLTLAIIGTFAVWLGAWRRKILQKLQMRPVRIEETTAKRTLE